MKTTVRCALLLLGLLLAAGPALAEDAAARIAAYDALVRSGKSAKLRAKLEGKGLLGVHSSVEGEYVDFWLTAEPAPGEKPGTQNLEKERFLGSGKTDSSGIAELEWKPDAAGSYEIEVRVRKGSKYVAIPASLELLCSQSGRLVLATIEETLTDLAAVTFMRKDAKDVKAAEGAAEALAKVAEKHRVVYVTGIEEVSLVKTKEWLKAGGFPSGPVFFWNISQNAFSGEKYKTGLFAKLHADFPALVAGIGGRSEDAVACVKNGVTSYLVGSSDSDVPAETIRVKTWDKLPAALERQLEVEAQVAALAQPDLEKQAAAGKALARLETGELGYLNRFLRASDPSVAAAARLAQGRIRARDAFAQSLDLSSDASALASLVAAWRSGDPSISARVYRDGPAGLAKAGPALERWRGIEVVNRTEPEPGKVVYRLRFLAEKDGAPSVERDYALLRGDDGTWKADAGDL